MPLVHFDLHRHVYTYKFLRLVALTEAHSLRGNKNRKLTLVVFARLAYSKWSLSDHRHRATHRRDEMPTSFEVRKLLSEMISRQIVRSQGAVSPGRFL